MDEELKKILGERIRSLRAEIEGLSQEGLANAIGLKRSAIGEMESGRKGASLTTLNNLANYFNVTIDYLLGRTSNKSNIVVKDTVNGDDIKIEVNKDKYPYGLTHDEVVEIVEAYKKLEQAGFKFVPPPDEEKK